MSHDQDNIREFVVECREGLDRIDNVLVAFEATPGKRTGLDIVLRALHTIKGNCGFLNYPKLGALAHAGESLLSKLFGGNLAVNAEVADVLLRLVDAIRNVLVVVEATGSEGTPNHDSLIQELARWMAVASGESVMPVSPPQDSSPAPVSGAAAPQTEDLQPNRAESPRFESTLFRDSDILSQPPASAVATPLQRPLPENQQSDESKSQVPPSASASGAW